MTLKTESGRVSGTILLHIVLGIAGQLLPLFGWVAGLVSAETWATIAAVLAAVQSIAGIIRRTLNGQTSEGPDGIAYTYGEPMRKPGGKPSAPGASSVGIVLPFLLLALIPILFTAALVVGTVLSGCAPATCKTIAVERFPAPEAGPKAKRIVQKCGDSEVTWVLTDGSPECMESCWEQSHD